MHGVSGTPPREMLNTDPVPRLDGDKYARVFRRRPSLDARHRSGRPYETEAFHWGSLTTGHWLTSLWVLLAPFAFANVAGWMALRRRPFHRAVIRLAGLALTALFVAQIGYVLVGVPLTFALDAGWGSTATSLARLGTSLSWVLAFGAIVLRLSTQSHFDPLDYGDRFELLFRPRIDAMRPPSHPPTDTFEDPADATVGNASMWQAHSIVHRLRRLHFTTGQLVIALVLARLIENETLVWLSVAGLAVVVALVIGTSYRPKSRVVLSATAWSTIIGEAIAVAAVALFTLSDLSPVLVAIHTTTFHIAIALGIAAGLTALAGIPGIGALTIATFLGGAFGVGAGLLAEDLLSTGDNLVNQGGAWVAPASLIFVLFVAITAILLAYRGPPDLASAGLVNRILSRLTRRSRALLAASAAFGLVAGAVAIIAGCVMTEGICEPGALSELPGADAAVLALIATALVLVAGLVWRYRPVLAAATIVVGGLVIWIGVTEPVILGLEPANYLRALPLSRTVIFVAPFVAILRSVLGAYRQGASSRKVGVIWDVASFWPRWFHPLGPPAYGPKVVTELSRLIGRGEVDVLAGHSQGSVIAAVAAHRAAAEGGRFSGLLTYGSPIGLLYGRLFPDTGMDRLSEELPGMLGNGWSNIWRIDDPIGGEPLGGNVTSVLDDRGSGHSGYEMSPTFREVRDRLV